LNCLSHRELGLVREYTNPFFSSTVNRRLIAQCSAMHYNAFMEDQVTVRIPRELNEALKQTAARMQRKPSEIIRMAVTEFLRLPGQRKEKPADKVRTLIGSLESGIPDLAVRHREYILKKLRRGR